MKDNTLESIFKNTEKIIMETPIEDHMKIANQFKLLLVSIGLLEICVFAIGNDLYQMHEEKLSEKEKDEIIEHIISNAQLASVMITNYKYNINEMRKEIKNATMDKYYEKMELELFETIKKMNEYLKTQQKARGIKF